MEHYGEVANNESNEKLDPSGLFARQKTGINRTTLALGFAITVFEESIYVFAVYWTAVLSKTHAKSGASVSPLPFGLIFSCLMCATMLGSMVYPSIIKWLGNDAKRVLLWTFGLAAIALLASVATRVETWTFWSFMLFEACIGVYFPAMSKLKGELVKEATRATVYALFRLPLNVFVIVMLNVFSKGEYTARPSGMTLTDADHREDNANGSPQVVGKEMAFLVNSGLLLMAVPILRVFL